MVRIRGKARSLSASLPATDNTEKCVSFFERRRGAPKLASRALNLLV